MNANSKKWSKKIEGERREARREERYRDIAPDVMVQCLANVLWTMNRSYGWGRKRLRGLIEALHETDRLQCEPSKLHSRFDGLDCEEEIKERFGIDLRGEFPVKIEVKP